MNHDNMQEPLHGEDNDGLWKVLVTPAFFIVLLILLLGSASYYFGYKKGFQSGQAQLAKEVTKTNE